MSRNLATLIILLLLSALPIPFVAAQTDKKTRSVSSTKRSPPPTRHSGWLKTRGYLKNTASTPKLSTRAVLCRSKRW